MWAYSMHLWFTNCFINLNATVGHAIKIFKQVKTMQCVLYTQNILYDPTSPYGQSRNCGWIPCWGNRPERPIQSWDLVNILAKGQSWSLPQGWSGLFVTIPIHLHPSHSSGLCDAMSSLTRAKKQLFRVYLYTHFTKLVFLSVTERGLTSRIDTDAYPHFFSVIGRSTEQRDLTDINIQV